MTQQRKMHPETMKRMLAKASLGIPAKLGSLSSAFCKLLRLINFCYLEYGRSNHERICFTPSTKIPNSWMTLIECRTCKQSIIATISLAYVQTVNVKLGAHQKLVIAGSLPDTWEISGCRPRTSNTPNVPYQC